MIFNDRRRPVRETRLWQAYDCRRYATLFYALLLTLILLPAVTTIGLPAILIKFLVLACLLAAVMPNARGRAGWVLVVATIFLMLARAASEDGLLPLNPGLVLVFVGVVGLAAAAATFRFAVASRGVNSETIYAALSTYLLAGIFFGQIYSSLNDIHAESVVGPDPLSDTSAIYYSFVTLATLGYGDFLPRTDVARGVATFEVIGGQLFLAVLVARLIGAFGENASGR
jgi:hypothetical protein